MQVICLEDEAFYALIDTVVKRIKVMDNFKEDKWISGEEAMKKMRISSKTTIAKTKRYWRNPIQPTREKNHSLRQ